VSREDFCNRDSQAKVASTQKREILSESNSTYPYGNHQHMLRPSSALRKHGFTESGYNALTATVTDRKAVIYS
jgi:hypothetical protein